MVDPPIGKDPTRRKIVLMGEPAVGKTAVARRWSMDHFNPRYEATIGVDFYSQEVLDVGLDLWDISGHPEFAEVRPSYFAGADAVLMVYDVCTRVSFDSLDMWIREAQRCGLTSIPYAVCANKTDQTNKPRLVAPSEGVRWAESRKFRYFEVSAATGQGIKAMFAELATALTQA